MRGRKSPCISPLDGYFPELQSNRRRLPRVAPPQPGAIFAPNFLASSEVERCGKEVRKDRLTPPRSTSRRPPPPTTGAKQWGGRKPVGSLTSLIWKEKRRRRCPGGYLNQVTSTLTNLRSLEDNTMNINSLGLRLLGIDVIGNSSRNTQTICQPGSSELGKL